MNTPTQEKKLSITNESMTNEEIMKAFNDAPLNFFEGVEGVEWMKKLLDIKDQELQQAITTAKREILREVQQYVEQVLQEERFSGAPFALNKIITHLKSELSV